MFVLECLYLHHQQLFKLKQPMDDKVIIYDANLSLFMYIGALFITDTEGANKVLVDFQQEVNKGIKSCLDDKANLENCQKLKRFLDHKLAELKFMGYTGGFNNQMVEKIESTIEILNTGIALGEKEQAYRNGGGSMAYKNLPWYRPDHNWDPMTLEGYLKLHYDTFSVPTFTLSEFLSSGYFKHCLMHNWGAKESAETFCRLYNKVG